MNCCVFITAAREYGNKRTKVFPKIAISKIVIKNSYSSEVFQDDKNKIKPRKIHLRKFIANWRDNISEEGFSKNSLGACFNKCS